MTQPIEEGMVLGGRYLVTGHVLTSADQDMVLDGRDQVLNRDVSILVASQEHAAQVAASARELATGERQGTVQVLDLGLSEGRTYLIAGGIPAPDELLDMTRDQQVYVEPFYTDTLGSEIFGEARTYEPHVYEDDDEYYDELDDSLPGPESEKRRPRFLRGLSERLSQRLGTEDAATDAVSGGAAGAAGAAAASGRPGHDAGPSGTADSSRPAVRREDEAPLPETISDDEWTGAHDEVTVDQARPAADADRRIDQDADRGQASDRGRASDHGQASDHGRAAEADGPATDETPVADGPEPDEAPVADGPETDETPVSGGPVTDEASTAAAAAPAASRQGSASDRQDRAPGDRPKVTLWEDDAPDAGPAPAADPDRGARRSGAGAAAAGVAAAGVAGSGAAATGAPVTGTAATGAAATGGAATAGGADYGTAYDDAEDAEFDDFMEDDEEEDKPSGARWLIGGILVLLLILGAVFAFNILGNNRNPEAGGGSTTSGSESGSPTESASEPASDLPEPVIVSATRLVPDRPGLSAETDNTLPNAVDGNPATAWQPYSFAQAAFGGYASNMALVVELEEPSAITQVDITQNNGSGGSFAVLLNDSPSLDGAQQIAEGSFTGPEISIPVPAGDAGPAEAQYVIINFTELPQLSNASSNLPYGLRIAEVTVE